MRVTIHIDGASRGNPGPAAFAYVITFEDGIALEENGRLGVATNNFAEYSALVNALERAAVLGAKQVLILSDSELLVKQMNGEYRVKHPDLRTLHEEARQLGKHFTSVAFQHVPRAENRHADRLCNEALNDKNFAPMSAPTLRPPPLPLAKPQLDLRQQAITRLRAAAARWAQGNPDQPAAEAVWQDLWDLLDAHGMLRRSPRTKKASG